MLNKKIKSTISGLFVTVALLTLISGCVTTAPGKKSSVNRPTTISKPARVTRDSSKPGDYEQPLVLKASKLLPKTLLSGPDFTIEERVQNDGFLNIYTLKSRFGNLRVVSTPMVSKRVNEIRAIAEIDKLSKTVEFAKGIAKAGKDVVVGAKDLVTNPVNTVTTGASGVKKLFGRADDLIVGQVRSDAEDSRTKSLIGFSKTKRDYGHALNVDVYSRNQLLQKPLDQLTWAGYSGDMAGTLALSAVGGAAGAALSVASWTNVLGNVFRDQSPGDLRIMNRQRLEAMGVRKTVADRFIANSTYTPREQTLLVEALHSTTGVKERAEFIRFAAQSDNGDISQFRQRQARMYAAYHKSVAPLKRFVPVGQIAAALTKKGVIVLNVPLDYLVWTEEMAQMIETINQKISTLPEINGTELRLTGQLTPMARQSLEEMGWTIYDKQQKLLPDNS